MDMEAAAWAAKRYFEFKVLIPCHYRTFPLLAQDAEAMVAAMSGSGTEVRTPEVMEPVEI